LTTTPHRASDQPYTIDKQITSNKHNNKQNKTTNRKIRHFQMVV